jgi:predicted methyltransferase
MTLARSWGLAPLLALTVACHPTPPPTNAAAAVPASPAAPPPAVEETSVKPGANAEFLKPDLDVAQWETRFERGGRDIFDHRADVLRVSGVRPEATVADVGAGTGLFTMLFADAVGPTGKVYAEDIAAKFVDHIRERARKENRPNVVPVLGTDRSVELPEASVDVAFVCDVYHHFEFPKSMLASIRRALKPGGELVVIDFVREPGKSEGWVLEHVRAGEETFVSEIRAAGFEPAARYDFLKQNYVRKFRRP